MLLDCVQRLETVINEAVINRIIQDMADITSPLKQFTDAVLSQVFSRKSTIGNSVRPHVTMDQHYGQPIGHQYFCQPIKALDEILSTNEYCSFQTSSGDNSQCMYVDNPIFEAIL